MPVPLASLPAVLLPWYDREKRSLPWRDIVTPYRTWVSEIMLQQTRVQAVLPYFERFMSAAPDVPAPECFVGRNNQASGTSFQRRY